MKTISKTEQLILAQAALGTRIRILRMERRLTQVALASLCQLHPCFLSDLERGKKNPSLKTLLAIAKAFRISLSLLFTDLPVADPLRHTEGGHADLTATEAIHTALIHLSLPQDCSPATMNDSAGGGLTIQEG